MSGMKLLILVTCSLALANGELRGQNTESKPKFNILKGPAKAPLGNVAHIDLPTGYVFINGKDYQALLKAEGEPVSGNELGSMRATNEHWSVVFEFSNIGYVKDDDKDTRRRQVTREYSAEQRGGEQSARRGGQPTN